MKLIPMITFVKKQGNTLKDISKCFPKDKDVQFSMIEELQDFLPFIKLK